MSKQNQTKQNKTEKIKFTCMPKVLQKCENTSPILTPHMINLKKKQKQNGIAGMQTSSAFAAFAEDSAPFASFPCHAFTPFAPF